MTSMLKKRLPDILFWTLLLAAWLGIGWAFYNYVLLPGGDIIAFEYQGRNVEILAPLFFGVTLGLPLFWIIQRFTLSDLPMWQRWTNVVLRALVVLALVGALVQVVLTSFESRISTIFIVDTSASIPDSVLEESRDYINQAIAAKGERDEVQVIAFASRPYQIKLGDDGKLAAIPRPEEEKDALETDISGALRMSYGLFPQDHLKRVVVVSDGNATRGDFVAEAYRAEAYGIRLYNKEIEFKPRPEVLVRGVDVPDELKIGEPFVFTARVFSTVKTSATLTLWQNDFKDGTQKVDLEPGLTEVQFKTEVYEPGFREFKVEMKVDGEDHFAKNNSFVYSANVRGKPRILYLEGEQRARHYLQRALRDENFEVETRGEFGVPTSLKDLEGFDLVLMSDVPALNVSDGQMQLIDRYIKELGGGFIMAGGESSFGPGGYKDSQMEKILPVKFEPKKERKKPTLALLLVIDKSGSMSGDRIELAKDAAKAAVEILQRNDKVGVLAFDDGNMPLVRMQSATNRVRILSSIGRLGASGGTNIAGALQEAYEMLALTPAKLKHIIILSDGHSDQANIFSEVLPAMRIENITVSSVAVGAQSDTTLLRRVAEGGGGRYYYTNDPYNVPRIFMKETNTVARTSLVEEPFRPRVVKTAQALKGIPWASAPYLLGFVTTKDKDAAEVLLETETGEPLLARWRYGLGKSVAFTSDIKNRWAVEWIRWPGYAKFWAQLIRDTMRSDDRDTLAMRTIVEQGKARVVVDAIDDEDRFINDLDSTVALTTPSGKKKNLKLRQTAPGRYETSIPLEEYGSYNLKAQHDKNGDTIAVSLGTVSNPYPQEYLFTEPNRDVLRRGADISRGETNPEVAKLFDPMGEEVKYRKELWPIFLMAAVALMLLDLMFRRLRLGGRTELAWTHVLKK
jgi:Mg-chelatase subunit ChlD